MNVESMQVGWIGTGVMGGAMAMRLIESGHKLRIYTRTKARAERLLENDAVWTDSPKACADGAEVVISIVGDESDVEQTYLGQEGVLAADSLPALMMDMTTSSPALAERLAAEAAARGVMSVDAPVSGGDIGAVNGTLSIMVGGGDDAVARVMPLLKLMGSRIVHQGGPGAGQHTKMVNQILIASSMVGVCEGLLYADKAGLDSAKVIEAVGAGAAGSWAINNLGPRMIKRDFEPGFFVEHFIKDLRLALAEAERLGLDLPGLQMAKRTYDLVSDHGYGRKGTQALLLMLESLHRGEPE